VKTGVFSKLAIVGFWMALAPSSQAQDLDSELELKPRTRWVLDQGFAPQILDCRLSDKSRLQCVAGENLIQVRCEATHFARRTEVRAVFKGRAFSCEGTRFDKQSLMSQWKLSLKSEEGSESVWIVDAADQPQLERLYRSEMSSLPLLARASRTYGSVGLLSRSLSWGGESLKLMGAELRWGRDRWIVGGDFYQALRAPNAETKNLLRVSGALSLGSGESGRGWTVGAASGHDFLKGGVRVSSHCLGPEYLLNPTSWRFAVSAGNCWISSSQVTFAPWAAAGVKRKIFGSVFLSADVYARSLTGSYRSQDVSGLELRTQLGVSVAIAPH